MFQCIYIRLIFKTYAVFYQFSNVSLSTPVTVTMPTVVDAYHMLTTRDEMTASCMVTLWYHGVMDTCSRPASKWNARSTSNVVKFSFTAKAGKYENSCDFCRTLLDIG